MTLGIQSFFYSKSFSVIRAVEEAWSRGWHKLWIESDSAAIVNYIASTSFLSPWCLYNSWQNCLHLLNYIEYRNSHIYREGNQAADLLANYGMNCPSFTWLHIPP